MTAVLESLKSRIVVVDDHPVVREGLSLLINQQKDLMVCGQASNVAEGLQVAETCHPDLAIVDLRLKEDNGLVLTEQLKVRFPKLRILILSQYDLPIYAEDALRAGALGFVIKAQAADEILTAIRSVLAGEIYLPRALANHLLHKLIGAGPKPISPSVEHLSERELHVLRLIGTGWSNKQVAGELGLSTKTIETHRENIKHKLGLSAAPQLLRFATEWASKQAPLSQSLPKTLVHSSKSNIGPASDARA